MKRSVYSPCDLCKNDPSAPPAWQFKAREISDDKELKLIEFRDAVLEVDGVPIFYTPYLSEPDPSVKRASGFLTPLRGTVTLGGRVVNDVPPYRRNTGMVFQSYALFPHMSVFDNVAFGLKVRHVGAADIARRVREARSLDGTRLTRSPGSFVHRRFGDGSAGGRRRRRKRRTPTSTSRIV